MIESASPLVQATLGTLFTWAVTAAGSGLVYFIPNASRALFDSALGFSGGVMLAASFWSLLAPAIEASQDYGDWAIVPSLVGFFAGAAFVYISDLMLPQDTVALLAPKSSVTRSNEKTQIVSQNKPDGLRQRKSPNGKKFLDLFCFSRIFVLSYPIQTLS